MDFQYLSTLFIRGEIKEAIEYLKQFPDCRELVAPYIDIFEKENYLSYELPEELNLVLLEYQIYFRNVFYLHETEENASIALFHRLSRLLNLPTVSYEEPASALEALFDKHGIHFMGGRTIGHYGPYVWKETTPVTYEVELPEGTKLYTVNILKDFVMKSWMGYLTFGEKGTRGWAGSDGIINCIEDAYDFTDDNFLVSLLKHEAQHVEDMKRWPDITAAELEYRAKLVEMIYSKSDLLPKFLSEADPDRPDNSHATASAWIADEMKDFEGRPLPEIQKKARELFTISTEKKNQEM